MPQFEMIQIETARFKIDTCSDTFIENTPQRRTRMAIRIRPVKQINFTDHEIFEKKL